MLICGFAHAYYVTFKNTQDSDEETIVRTPKLFNSVTYSYLLALGDFTTTFGDY